MINEYMQISRYEITNTINNEIIKVNGQIIFSKIDFILFIDNLMNNSMEQFEILL